MKTTKSYHREGENLLANFGCMSQKIVALGFMLATAFLLGGCATLLDREAAPAPLTLAQIKEMPAQGVSDESILGTLRASRAVYTLTTTGVLELIDAKVSPAVIDYLLSTPQLYPPQPPPYYPGYYYYPPPWPYWHGDPYWGWHRGFRYP